MLSFFVFLAYVACLLPVILSARRHALGRSQVTISALLVIFLTVFLNLLRIYTEVLWFQELGQVHRYWTVFWTRFFLFVGGFLVSSLFFYMQIRMAEKGFARETNGVRRVVRIVYFVFAILISISLGSTCSSWWEKVLLCE